MKYKEFEKIIKTHKYGMGMIHELYELGFDMMEGEFKLSSVIDDQFYNTLNLFYNEEGVEWINWFIYESDYGKKDFTKMPIFEKNTDGITILSEKISDGYGAHDEDGKPICHSFKSLWKYINKNHKL